MSLVDLNYNFECDWFVELSDYNLASELVGNKSFLNHPGKNPTQDPLKILLLILLGSCRILKDPVRS